MTSIERFINETIEYLGPDHYKLLCDFFFVFARFEGALKKTGYVYGVNHAQPDWKRFELTLEGRFNKERSPEIKDAVVYLLSNPPKVQSFKDGELGWSDFFIKDNQTEINIIGSAIRGVRNNLFHGGKFNSGIVEDIPRNILLIQSAFLILEEWLSLDAETLQKFAAPIV